MNRILTFVAIGNSVSILPGPMYASVDKVLSGLVKSAKVFEVFSFFLRHQL